jgi:hypothetical protein
MSDRPQYEHDASKGETRYPPEEGAQFGGRPGERDPHSRLNTPLSELDQLADTDDGAVGSDEERRAEEEGGDPVESTRTVEDGEAETALRRAEDEAGGTIQRDR